MKIFKKAFQILEDIGADIESIKIMIRESRTSASPITMTPQKGPVEKMKRKASVQGKIKMLSAPLKIGDRVRVARRMVDAEGLTDGCRWVSPEMDKYEGRVYKVREINGENRFILSGVTHWTFVSEWLDKVVDAKVGAKLRVPSSQIVNRIRRFRKSRGISVERFCRIAGMSDMTGYRIERKKDMVRSAILRKVDEYLKSEGY